MTQPEGVDIPAVNQIIMLRPTQSAIIFVQQLGRGLRLVKDKEYTVVLDFIGNYQNNFMIPMALSDDRTYNKDNIRRFVEEGTRVIPGCSTIHFDEVAKRRIYESIDKAKFNSVAVIKKAYLGLRNRLGRVPTYMDFEEHDAIDLSRLFMNKSLGSYHTFLTKHEKSYQREFNEIQEAFLRFVSMKLAIGHRPHELLAIKEILSGHKQVIQGMLDQLPKKYGIKVSDQTKTNVIHVLTNKFQTGAARKTFENIIFIEKDKAGYVGSESFVDQLEDADFLEAMADLVDYGLYRNATYFGHRYKKTSFQLYQKYSYEDVCRLLEWEQNIVPLNIGGYKYDEKTKTYPVFINYHKKEEISNTIKYEDRFKSPNRLVAISKSKRTVVSNDIQTALHAEDLGVHLELFVRKNKDDKMSKEFYYLGRMSVCDEPNPIKMANTKGELTVDAVELTYQLDQPVREELYDYILQESSS